MNKKSSSLGNISPLAQARIKTELKEKGWTQKQLAENIFVHDKYLSKVLNGKCPINSGLIGSIAKALSVRPEYLLYHDDFKTEKEYLEAMGDDDYLSALTSIDYFRSIGYEISFFKLQDIETNDYSDEIYISVTSPDSEEESVLSYDDFYKIITSFEKMAHSYLSNLCTAFMLEKHPDLNVKNDI